jgi:hypothetical protein
MGAHIVALGVETSRTIVLRLHTVWYSAWRPLESVQHVHSIHSGTGRLLTSRPGSSGGSGVPPVGAPTFFFYGFT